MNQTLQQNTYANFERLRAKLWCTFESGVCVRECMYAYMYSKSYNNRSKYLSNDMYFKSETLLRLYYNKRTDAIQLMPNGDPIYPSSTSDLAKASLTLLSSLASWLVGWPATVFQHGCNIIYSIISKAPSHMPHQSEQKFLILHTQHFLYLNARILPTAHNQRSIFASLTWNTFRFKVYMESTSREMVFKISTAIAVEQSNPGTSCEFNADILCRWFGHLCVRVCVFLKILPYFDWKLLMIFVVFKNILK